MNKAVSNRIKILNFLGILLLLYAAVPPENGKQLSSPFYEYGEYLLGTSSVLKVNGKTNINTFSCFLQKKFPKGSFFYKTNPDTSVVRFDNTELKIPTKEMDCGKKVINKDFYKALEADEFPFIIIELKEVINQDYNASEDLDNQDFFLIKTTITITNVSRSISIPVHIIRRDSFNFMVSGSINIQLSDFGIQAPKAMMGLIKVKNAIDIEFDLEINLVSAEV